MRMLCHGTRGRGSERENKGVSRSSCVARGTTERRSRGSTARAPWLQRIRTCIYDGQCLETSVYIGSVIQDYYWYVCSWYDGHTEQRRREEEASSICCCCSLFFFFSGHAGTRQALHLEVFGALGTLLVGSVWPPRGPRLLQPVAVIPAAWHMRYLLYRCRPGRRQPLAGLCASATIVGWPGTSSETGCLQLHVVPRIGARPAQRRNCTHHCPWAALLHQPAQPPSSGGRSVRMGNR